MKQAKLVNMGSVNMDKKKMGPNKAKKEDILVGNKWKRPRWKQDG